MRPSEVLAKAADLIEPEGAWGQGGRNPKTPGGECADCVMTAIWHFSGGSEAERFLRQAIGHPAPFSVFDWNDEPERSQAEVVKALRDAADRARAEGQ